MVFFQIGDVVEKIVGVKLVGHVINRIPQSDYSDGSYRLPESYENPVFVKWNDNTKGWISKSFLTIIA